MGQIFANNVAGAIASGGLAESATTLSLVDASSFPDPGANWYLVTLANSSETAWEIVKVTAKSGNDLTVERAQEGTADGTWAAGTTVEMRLTAAAIQLASDAVVPAGGAVGQVLSKTSSTDYAATWSTPVKLDAAQSWTAQQTFKETKGTFYALTGTVIDPANGEHQRKTITGNTTFTEALEDGQRVSLRFALTGAYTITWPSIEEWIGGEPEWAVGGSNLVVFWKETTSLFAVGKAAS
jgi:hypothetical protein